jgi:hypothetical protein
MESTFDLTALDLKDAFAQPGCAVCRLRTQRERTYLRDEPKFPAEQVSWVKAVAFFAGEKQVNSPFTGNDG